MTLWPWNKVKVIKMIQLELLILYINLLLLLTLRKNLLSNYTKLTCIEIHLFFSLCEYLWSCIHPTAHPPTITPKHIGSQCCFGCARGIGGADHGVTVSMTLASCHSSSTPSVVQAPSGGAAWMLCHGYQGVGVLGTNCVLIQPTKLKLETWQCHYKTWQVMRYVQYVFRLQHMKQLAIEK